MDLLRAGLEREALLPSMRRDSVTLRQRIKRHVVPVAVTVCVAALCVPLWRAVGGPTVFGLPWWVLLVAFGVELFALWWLFVRGNPA